MTSINILSLNVNGLQSNNNERADVFNLLLQLIHSSVKDEKQRSAEWGYKLYISHGTSKSAGVVLLIKNNLDYSDNQVISDKNGRYITLNILIEDFRISLLNLCGPNSDSPEVFDNHMKYLNLPGSVIRAVDWNVVQEYSLDNYNYIKDNNKKIA